jgi:hypothetical protein
MELTLQPSSYLPSIHPHLGQLYCTSDDGLHAEAMPAMRSQAAAQMTHLIIQNPFCFTSEGALRMRSRLAGLGSNVEVPNHLQCNFFN